MENQKFEHRSIIKFLVLEGQSPSNIHERMTAIYGDSAPSRTMVFEWVPRFKNGQLNIEESPRSWRPISTTDEKTIKVVENLVIEDRRITIQEIAEILSISSGTVHGILHDHLHMTKVCSTCVPHLLTPLQRHERVEACEELLARYETEGNDFLSRIITGDESWFYYHQPESKQSPKQWKRADSPPPTTLKQEKSEQPVPAGTTITKTYYANLLINKVHSEIKERRRGLISAGKGIQYVQGAPAKQRRIRRLSNIQHINKKHVRQDRFVFSRDYDHFFESFETDTKFNSLMIQQWHRNFIANHRADGERIYRDTLGPYCYLLYSYLCLRSPFGIDFHRGTVHPGAWLHPGMIGRFQKEMKNGDNYLTWLGFTSTTKKYDVAQSFHGNTLFEILLSDTDHFTCQGIDISALSKFPHEEVLLLSGFQFEIVDVKSFDPTEEKQFPHFHIQIIPRQCNYNV
ncbi:unnamed protein product [Rotaria sp. Silwood1]|nr:unnamed protein product [Rotaria sp. Silwood1]